MRSLSVCTHNQTANMRSVWSRVGAGSVRKFHRQHTTPPREDFTCALATGISMDTFELAPTVYQQWRRALSVASISAPCSPGAVTRFIGRLDRMLPVIRTSKACRSSGQTSGAWTYRMPISDHCGAFHAALPVDSHFTVIARPFDFYTHAAEGFQGQNNHAGNR